MPKATLRREQFIRPVALSKSDPVSMVQGVVKQSPTPNTCFGFIVVKDIRNDVFVAQRIIKEAGALARFVQGAVVSCDIECRGERGFRVTKIHSVTPPH